MKKFLRILIVLLLLAIGLLYYVVKNPELPISQKVMTTLGIQMTGNIITEKSDVDENFPCPQRSQPGPGFCPDGKIVDGGKDDHGCDLPPDCEK